MPWNAELYLTYGDERTRPSADLAARIALAEPKTIADLGCGPGNSTRVLHERWPGARTLGVDSSPEMIESARAQYPDREWELADIAAWSPPDTFDLVFSNAALQWLGDHAALLGRLFGHVAPDGALAFQIPSNAFSAVRAYIDEVADDPEWRDLMAGPRSALTIETPEAYYDSLAPLARSVDMWETIYYHVMAGPDAIVEWMSGTGLRPYLDVLEAAEQERFVDRLLRKVAEGYPRRSDGQVLFPFRRLFVIAYK